MSVELAMQFGVLIQNHFDSIYFQYLGIFFYIFPHWQGPMLKLYFLRMLDFLLTQNKNAYFVKNNPMHMSAMFAVKWLCVKRKRNNFKLFLTMSMILYQNLVLCWRSSWMSNWQIQHELFENIYIKEPFTYTVLGNFKLSRNTLALAAMQNFRMTRKSCKLLRTTQVTFLPYLVPFGPQECEKYIEMIKDNGRRR